MPPAPPPPKLIYFAERHPALDAAGFVARWRQHGRLGMSLPRWRNIARYLQCDRIDLPGTLTCDGVALVTYRSEATLRAHVADRDGSAIMKADELETFARPVAGFAVLTEEQSVVPVGLPDCKLFLRLDRAAGLSAEEFRKTWLRVAGPRIREALVAPGLATGYAQNFARAPLAGGPPLCDGVDEIDCAEPAACMEALAPLLAALRDLASVRPVATRPTQLHPPPP